MSVAYSGIYVMLLSMILPKLGVQIGNDEITTFVSVVVAIVGAVIGMYGRYKHGGVTALGLRTQ